MQGGFLRDQDGALVLSAGSGQGLVLAQNVDDPGLRFSLLAQSMPGLVAGYLLNEKTGTTLADFGPNALPLTKGAQGTLGGAAVIPECDAALTSATGSGIAASRAVTAGTPLQLSTGVTFLVLVRMGTPGSTRHIGGRNANWNFRAVGGAGVQQAIVTVGAANKVVVGRTALTSGRRALLATTYDGREAVFVINGNIEGRITAPGTITATTDPLEIGGVQATNAFDGQIQGVLIFNRPLSLGEIRKLQRAADVTLDPTEGAAIIDLLADSDPAIAAASKGRYCGWCSGQMRVTERAIVGANDAFHTACLTGSRKGLQQALSATSAAPDYGSWAVGLIRECINGASRRTTPDRTIYHDGTKFISPGISYAVGSANYETVLGMGVAAAIMARYLGGSATGPWTKLTRLEVANALARQVSYGGFETAPGTRSNVFTQMELGMMVLLTKGIVEDATWQTWKTAFLASATFLRDGGGGFNPELAFYVNGNFEVMEAISYWIAYRLTGDAAWNTAYETQIEFMIAPSALADGNAIGGKAAGFGLKNGAVTGQGTVTTTSGSNVLASLSVGSGVIDATSVGKPITGPGIPGGSEISDVTGTNVTIIGPSGAAANATASASGVAVVVHSGAPITSAALMGLSDTTDKAYFAETPAGTKPGLDWGYLQLQLSFVTRAWLISADARWLKLMNLMRNKVNERLNRSTWTLDATGGTRQNIATAWLTHAEHALVLKAGRADITLADLASQITTATSGMEANYRSQFLTNGALAYYRGVGLELGAVLMSMPDWPGTPA